MDPPLARGTEHLYDRVLPLGESSFSSRLQAVEERIRSAAERSGRKRADITLVAVTKKFSAQTIREAYAAGLRHFGENYVQEFAQKHSELKDLADAKFHLIGHLQSNKARVATELFDVVQTADSAKIVSRLDALVAEAGRRMDVLIEMKLSGEESKTGVSVEELAELAAAGKACRHIRVSGLMTMPPWSENPEDSRPFFRKLAELARQHEFPQLSMGMSNDFEAAIEEGATIIRVGTALFGPRPKPAMTE